MAVEQGGALEHWFWSRSMGSFGPDDYRVSLGYFRFRSPGSAAESGQYGESAKRAADSACPLYPGPGHEG